MSRLGKLPIELPEGTEAKLESGFIIVKGPKGELRQKLHPAIKIEVDKENKEGKQIKISMKNKENEKEKRFWGLYWSLVGNMVRGVNEEFSKKLEINGVGYRAKLENDKLILNVGYSNPVEYELPEGISVKVEKNIITISGIDKYLVGETAAGIRSIRKPEPYKGKGIKYIDEVIRRKSGKTVGGDSK